MDIAEMVLKIKNGKFEQEIEDHLLFEDFDEQFYEEKQEEDEEIEVKKCQV